MGKNTAGFQKTANSFTVIKFTRKVYRKAPAGQTKTMFVKLVIIFMKYWKKLQNIQQAMEAI